MPGHDRAQVCRAHPRWLDQFPAIACRTLGWNMTEYYRYVSLKFTAQFTPEQLLNNSEWTMTWTGFQVGIWWCPENLSPCAVLGCMSYLFYNVLITRENCWLDSFWICLTCLNTFPALLSWQNSTGNHLCSMRNFPDTSTLRLSKRSRQSSSVNFARRNRPCRMSPVSPLCSQAWATWWARPSMCFTPTTASTNPGRVCNRRAMTLSLAVDVKSHEMWGKIGSLGTWTRFFSNGQFKASKCKTVARCLKSIILYWSLLISLDFCWIALIFWFIPKRSLSSQMQVATASSNASSKRKTKAERQQRSLVTSRCHRSSKS